MINVFIIALIFVLVYFDLMSKNYALTNYSGKRKVINKLLVFTLVKNYGAAFGFMKRKRLLLKIITAIIIIILCIYFIIAIFENYILLKVSIGLILSGAIGNFFDRIKRGYVIDFIYFPLKRWPVFNLADFYIFIGSLLVIYITIFTEYLI